MFKNHSCLASYSFHNTPFQRIKAREQDYRKVVLVLNKDGFHIFYMEIRCKIHKKYPCIQILVS